MKIQKTLLLVMALGLLGSCRDKTPAPQPTPPPPPPGAKRLLVLTQTKGYRHSSVDTIVATLRHLGDSTQQWYVGRRAESDADVAQLVTADSLRNFDAVVFANTTGDLTFTPAGRLAFYQWIKDGGAYIGIHSASDTFHGDSLYLDLLRGEFDHHPAPLTVNIIPQDTLHPACVGMPSRGFPFREEIYVFRNWERARVHVLLAQRSDPVMGAPGDYPVAWTHRAGQGRMFYTALGHFEETYQNALFRRHLVGGVRWALGLATGDETPGNPPR